jgi:hypothetical protein
VVADRAVAGWASHGWEDVCVGVYEHGGRVQGLG